MKLVASSDFNVRLNEPASRSSSYTDSEEAKDYLDIQIMQERTILVHILSSPARLMALSITSEEPYALSRARIIEKLAALTSKTSAASALTSRPLMIGTGECAAPSDWNMEVENETTI